MSPHKSLRVAVAADQAITRRGLASLVRSVQGTDLVGEARSHEETEQLCHLTGPDLVLLDFKTALELNVEIVQRIRHGQPDLEVILLVSSQEEQQLLETPIEEICCYFSRDISEEEFIEALRQIGASRFPIPAGEIPGQLDGKPGVEQVTPPELPGPSRTAHTLAQELAMAGQIQSSLLPENVPEMAGWQVAARLVAARETSGDFYDFIPVGDKNWALVIADVADKGMGAALFMTLTSTLIRNFAARYPTLPALTMDAVNDRILSDTHGNMYVTAFFGVLEPHTGRLRYANAGHPPPILVKNQRGKPVDRLGPTGMALGVLEKFHWKQKLASLVPGDVLFLYTDGILEALNEQGQYFGEQRLREVLLAHVGLPAGEILEAILNEVLRYTAASPRQDDIALVVITRKP